MRYDHDYYSDAEESETEEYEHNHELLQEVELNDIQILVTNYFCTIKDYLDSNCISLLEGLNSSTNLIKLITCSNFYFKGISKMNFKRWRKYYKSELGFLFNQFDHRINSRLHYYPQIDKNTFYYFCYVNSSLFTR